MGKDLAIPHYIHCKLLGDWLVDALGACVVVSLAGDITLFAQLGRADLVVLDRRSAFAIQSLAKVGADFSIVDHGQPLDLFPKW